MGRVRVAAGVWGVGEGRERGDPRSEVEGSREQTEAGRRSREKEGRPKLFFFSFKFTGGGLMGREVVGGEKEKKEITEYIDLFYSLHHLYKYI